MKFRTVSKQQGGIVGEADAGDGKGGARIVRCALGKREWRSGQPLHDARNVVSADSARFKRAMQWT
jgi:hypothetical protein